jgi:hypothetical protein
LATAISFVPSIEQATARHELLATFAGTQSTPEFTDL